MSLILNRYLKIVRLKADNVEQSHPLRAALDEQVHQAVTALTSHEPKLEITRSVGENGNCSIQVSAHGFDIAISSRAGQDTTFQGGARRTFISYTLSASTSLCALDRAVSFSENITMILRGAGGVLFAFLFFCGVQFVFRGSGPHIIHIHLEILVPLVIAGAWIGERLGNFLGNRLEAHAAARAEQRGALPQLDFLWSELENRFNKLLQSYEQV
jgi:hypothetical protein